MNMTLDKGTNMLSVTLSSLKFGIISLSLTTKVFREKKKSLAYLWLQHLVAMIVCPLPRGAALTESENFPANSTDQSSDVERGSHTPVATRFVGGKAGPEPDLRAPTAPAVRPCSSSLWAEFSMLIHK